MTLDEVQALTLSRKQHKDLRRCKLKDEEDGGTKGGKLIQS